MNNKAYATSPPVSRNRTIQTKKNYPMQRFVVRVGYDAGLEASPNKLIANSQKTVKNTADKLLSIDNDTVNATKLHDYPTFSLSNRGTSSTNKTPVHMVGHGKPGGKLSGAAGILDAADIAQTLIGALKGKNQEFDFIKLYSCFSLNEENTEQSSVAKFKSALSSDSITSVPVYGAKGLLIPGETNTSNTELKVNVIPRRYSSAAFGKKETNGYFKSKFVSEMSPLNDGTWESPKTEAATIINKIVDKVNRISYIPNKFLIDNASSVLPPQQLQEDGTTSGTINYEAAPSGEPTQSNKMEAAAIGAKLTLNTLKTDIASQSSLSDISSKADSAISDVDSKNGNLETYINSTDFKTTKALKDILK